MPVTNSVLNIIGNPKINNLSVITGIHATRNMLQSMNGLTYIWDKNWIAEPGVLPFAFFNIIDIKENKKNEVTTKKIIMYKPNTGGADSIASGVVETIADNIVAQPKSYTINCLVPYRTVSETPEKLGSVLTNIAAFLSVSTPTLNEAVSASAEATYKVLMRLFKLLEIGNATASTIAGINPDYNKLSLEKMADTRHLLKFKNWDNWEYKDVVITDVQFSKSGTKDGYYDCTMTLQEMPVVIVTSKPSAALTTSRSSMYVTNAWRKTVEATMNSLQTVMGNKYVQSLGAIL